MKILKHLGTIVTLLGALTVLGIMLSTASPVSNFSDLLIALGFYIWVILPFALLMILTSSIHRKGLSIAARVAIFLASMLVVGSSVPIYWASIFGSESSTSALVFIFVPIYSLLAIAVVYVFALLLLKVVMSKHELNQN